MFAVLLPYVHRRRIVTSTAVTLCRRPENSGDTMARRKKDSKLDTRSARDRPRAATRAVLVLVVGWPRARLSQGQARRALARQALRRRTRPPVLTPSVRPTTHSTKARSASTKRRPMRANGWRSSTRARDDAPKGPYTVNQACDDYLEHLRSEGRSEAAVKDAGARIDAFIRPELGTFELARLKAAQLRKWRSDIAAAAARISDQAGTAPKVQKSGR